MNIKPFPFQKPQKGAALTMVMAATAAIMGLVAAVTQIQSRMQQNMFREHAKSRQIQIQKKISASMINPFILRATAENTSIEGNRMLKRCLGLASATESPRYCDPSKEYALLLGAGDKHLYQTDGNDYTNCPQERHISCFLAGSFDDANPLNTSRVHYSLDNSVGDGSVESVGDSHPFFAQVFFKPVCNPSPSGQELTPGSQCAFADLLQLRAKITHIKTGECIASGSGSNALNARNPACLPQFGPEPKNESWINVSRSKIIGSVCNQGATVRGLDSEGNIICICHKPYFLPTGDSNNNGPLCEADETTECPENFIQLGRNDKGQPICKLPSLHAETWYKTLCTNTAKSLNNSEGNPVDFCKVSIGMDAITGVPRDLPSVNTPPYQYRNDKEVDCSQAPTTVPNALEGGWISNITHECASSVSLLEAEGEKDPDVVLILAVGIGAFLIGYLLIGGFLGPLVLAALAILIIFIIFSEWEWNIPNASPSVQCEIQVECKSFRR